MKTIFIHLTVFMLLVLSGPAVMLLGAQHNLAPNPGFEPERNTPPSETHNLVPGPGQLVVPGWCSPTAGTPDFYNSSRSTFLGGQPIKKARSGQGRMGLIVNAKNGVANEYIQARLDAPLKKNHFYCITLHYALDQRCDYFSGHLGVCFTQDALEAQTTGSLFRYGMENNVVLLGNDTLNACKTGWVSCSIVYQAMGNEQYMTIGCFEPAYAMDVNDDDPAHHTSKGKGIFSSLAYYYIDDVSVTEITGEPLCNESTSERSSFNHFVFLIDASASMQKAGYLGQIRQHLLQLVDSLEPGDLVSVFRFDLRTQNLLSNTPAADKQQIAAALDRLEPGTVTNTDKALSVAYAFIDSLAVKKENTRLILVSDARFNLSKLSRKTILTHAGEQGVVFCAIQYGPVSNRLLQRTIAKAKGIYVQAGKQAVEQALIRQALKPAEAEYTPRTGKGRPFQLFTGQ